MTLLIAAQTCPLCQQANGCAMAQGFDIEVCWCVKQAPLMASITDQYQATSTLAALAANQCLCEACMVKLGQQVDINPVKHYKP